LKRYFPKYLLALIFTLLQCVAPLVHAHVSGNQSGVLPPSLTVQQQLSDHLIIKSADSIEENESPAIIIPHEYKQHNQSSIPRSQQTGILDLLCLTDITIQTASDQPVMVLSPYNKSHPQAPPELG
jgi:hypothetical protein